MTIWDVTRRAFLRGERHDNLGCDAAIISPQFGDRAGLGLAGGPLAGLLSAQQGAKLEFFTPAAGG